MKSLILFGLLLFVSCSSPEQLVEKRIKLILEKPEYLLDYLNDRSFTDEYYFTEYGIKYALHIKDFLLRNKNNLIFIKKDLFYSYRYYYFLRVNVVFFTYIYLFPEKDYLIHFNFVTICHKTRLQSIKIYNIYNDE